MASVPDCDPRIAAERLREEARFYFSQAKNYLIRAEGLMLSAHELDGGPGGPEDRPELGESDYPPQQRLRGQDQPPRPQGPEDEDQPPPRLRGRR